MGREACNVMIGGEAGQGLATIGELLAKSLVRAGYRLVVTQDYQSRIRGGHNTFTIRVGGEDLQAPQEPVDLLAALNQDAVDLHRREMAPDGLIIGDSSLELGDRALALPFKELAEGRFFNIAALGIIGALLGLDEEIPARLLETVFGKKHPEIVDKNREALSRAYAWCREQAVISFKLPPVAEPPRRLLMNGNEAIALGALAAGVKFYAFYPMTPSTSIGLNLAAQAEKMGLVVEQAEDEIAAVNMALGASFAGAPSMTATSGGGFALMVEGVSLAAMTETPLVIGVVQRPGPATGLPTRTEQADLGFILHAGHGEFGRAVFAPGTVEECFHLTRRAFDLAERFQGPVFILSDQFLSDSYRAVDPFDLDQGPEARPGAGGGDIARPYQRYALTDTGLSPRLLPGLSEHLIVADSDEHTPDGHLTEDLQVRRLMMEKRLNKAEGLKREVVPPSWFGPERPELLLVCWGTTQGSAREAAGRLTAGGLKTAVLHFAQVWPLVPEQFVGRLEEAGRVVAVESNATGQLARLIRRETGFFIKDIIPRSDGLPITPEYILGRLSR